ncbi:DUF1499 domain-containing protein [Rhizobium halophilum]|uniref:DUF1499 domain-containing protein n=1 Tax=Rhizobium halophilum TaxID=2846852 RepID=UPI001EFE2BAF|nr:DUF1499 domain-containing protein [Rhizobium halophilum]MCF6369879.1 DUF1499 domain-containing protein [Rhizobium halophilum]
MTVRYVRPISHSAYAARRIASGALVLFVLTTLGHRFGPLRTPDFLALILLAAAIAAASVPLAMVGLVRLWQKGAEGGLASAKALVYAAVPLAVVFAGAVPYMTRPALHEVSTDTEEPPAFLVDPDYDQEWLSGRNAVTLAERRAQTRAYPGLTGRRYEGALDRVLEGVEAAAFSSRVTLEARQAEGLVLPEDDEEPADAEVTLVLPQAVPVPVPRPGPRPPRQETVLNEEVLAPAGELLIQGEARTLLFGLPFDIVIRLREDEETTSVDVRVASRYGAHDLGLSAEIAEDFLDRLDAELLGIAGS